MFIVFLIHRQTPSSTVASSDKTVCLDGLIGVTSLGGSW